MVMDGKDRIIFTDLDGVLVNFIKGCMSALNITNYTIPRNEYDIEKWPGVNLTTKQFWAAIDKTDAAFWTNLEKYEWSDDLVNLCQKMGDTYFCTAPSRNPYCVAGKMQWIINNYFDLRRKIIITPHKYLCAAPNRILIDDSEIKIDKFIKYNGIGILFPQPYNRAWDEFKNSGKTIIKYIEEKINE